MKKTQTPQVKVGDKLAFARPYGDGYSLEKVVKITQTGRIVCEHHILDPDLSIRGRGRGYGGPYRGEIVTPKIRERIERDELLGKLGSVKWKEFSTQSLWAVAMEVDGMERIKEENEE